MNKKVYQDLLKMEKARRAYLSSRKTYINELMALIQKYGEIEIDDEDFGNPDENDYSKRIFTTNEDHGYCYSPTFDRVKVVEDADGKHMEFHAKDGDGLFVDNTWVSINDFSDNAWEELLDCIDFRTL